MFAGDRLNDAGISDGALEFPAVADDGGGVHQSRERSVPKTSDPLWNEVLEGVAIGLPLAQNRHPAQPRLSAFEHQEFEQQAVIMDGHAPFAVVVIDHQRIAFSPATSLHAPTLPSPASGGRVL